MKALIAGVIQVNKNEEGRSSQAYRSDITKILKSIIDIEVINPDIKDPDRSDYSFEQVETMFLKYCKIATQVDLLIVYIPGSSMGTAIEMWQAYNADIPILTISTYAHNWVVKLLSTYIFNDIEEFRSKMDIQFLKGVLSKSYMKSIA